MNRNVLTMVDLPPMSEEGEVRFSEQVVMMGERFRLQGHRIPLPSGYDVVTVDGGLLSGKTVRILTIGGSELARKARVRKEVLAGSPPELWKTRSIRGAHITMAADRIPGALDIEIVDRTQEDP